MTTILEEIAAFKREKEVPALLVQSPIEEYKRLATSPADPLDFIEHLTQAEGIALLAEIKKAYGRCFLMLLTKCALLS